MREREKEREIEKERERDREKERGYAAKIRRERCLQIRNCLMKQKVRKEHFAQIKIKN